MQEGTRSLKKGRGHVSLKASAVASLIHALSATSSSESDIFWLHVLFPSQTLVLSTVKPETPREAAREKETRASRKQAKRLGAHSNDLISSGLYRTLDRIARDKENTKKGRTSRKRPLPKRCITRRDAGIVAGVVRGVDSESAAIESGETGIAKAVWWASIVKAVAMVYTHTEYLTTASFPVSEPLSREKTVWIFPRGGPGKGPGLPGSTGFKFMIHCPCTSASECSTPGSRPVGRAGLLES